MVLPNSKSWPWVKINLVALSEGRKLNPREDIHRQGFSVNPKNDHFTSMGAAWRGGKENPHRPYADGGLTMKGLGGLALDANKN